MKAIEPTSWCHDFHYTGLASMVRQYFIMIVILRTSLIVAVSSKFIETVSKLYSCKKQTVNQTNNSQSAMSTQERTQNQEPPQCENPSPPVAPAITITTTSVATSNDKASTVTTPGPRHMHDHYALCQILCMWQTLREQTNIMLTVHW